jgi:hypothetical protein
MAEKATKPKKKPFLTVGVPGGRSGGLGPGIAQPNLVGQMQGARPKPMKGPVVSEAGQTGAPAGRPKSNIGNYLIRPTDTSITGFEMLNDSPDVLDAVHTKFMQKFELPTHLRPTRFLSPELEHGRGLAISKGFRKPRSRSA